jgi:transcriptional regulator with AAA-type ATPase domain
MDNAVELSNYRKIKNIISGIHDTLDADSTSDKIRQAIGTEQNEEYINSIIDFFNMAIQNDNPDIKELFRDVFFDDFIQNCGFFETTCIAMQLVGLDDIILTDIRNRRVPSEEDSALYEPMLQKLKETFYHAQFEIPLLIVGETGTSKELIAKTIHILSHRRKKPFLEINCAAIPESIFESELFGVIPDYPGFHNPDGMMGKIAMANDGILFLDELGKMDKRLQAKLLKAIEEQEITSVGAGKPVPINVRFLAASQPKDLENILPDLKYRLGYPDIIKMPTLNERLNEAGEFIIEHTFTGIKRGMGIDNNQLSLTNAVKTMLSTRRYDGNYRELGNILRGALILASADNRKEILPEDFRSVIEFSGFSSADNKRRILHTEFVQENISVIDIIDTADRIKASVVEDKLISFLRTGLDLKSAFLSEGKSENDYQNFLKKVKKITGKGIRDLAKKISSSEI